MTPSELTARLEKIKAACRKAVELGEKATAGPWAALPTHLAGTIPYIEPPSGAPVCRMLFDSEQSLSNASFIAFSRTFTPFAASALLTAIEGLEGIANNYRGDGVQRRALSHLHSITELLPEGLG